MSQVIERAASGWTDSDDANPQTRRLLVIVTSIVLASLATIPILAWVQTKFVARRSFAKEDFFLILACALALVTTACECISTNHLSGYHGWDIQAFKLRDYTTETLTFVSVIFFEACMYFVKISFTLSLSRIFTSKIDAICLYSLMILLPWTGAIVIMLFMFQCQPMNSFWNMSTSRSQCLPGLVLYMPAAGVDLVTNLIVFLWPIRRIFTRSSTPPRPWESTLQLALGLCVCIASAIRIWRLEVYFTSSDLFFEWPSVYVASAFEYWFAIIVACVTYLEPCYSAVSVCIFGRSTTKTTGNADGKTWRRIYRPDSKEVEANAAIWVADAQSESRLSQTSSAEIKDEQDLEKGGLRESSSIASDTDTYHSCEAHQISQSSLGSTSTEPSIDCHRILSTNYADLKVNTNRLDYTRPSMTARLSKSFLTKRDSCQDGGGEQSKRQSPIRRISRKSESGLELKLDRNDVARMMTATDLSLGESSVPSLSVQSRNRRVYSLTSEPRVQPPTAGTGTGTGTGAGAAAAKQSTPRQNRSLSYLEIDMDGFGMEFWSENDMKLGDGLT